MHCILRPFATVAIPVLVLAACGGDDTDGASSSAGATTGTSASSGGGGEGGTSSATTTQSAGGGGAAATSTTGGGGQGGQGGAATTTTTGPTCVPGETGACYSGPPATEGVGLCVPGEHVCGNDGTFGPCTGEVVPVNETCLTPYDDNCNGTVNESGIGCNCSPGETTACYNGPNGTENVGTCVAGVATCDAQGLGYDACVGENTPQPEDCLTAEDEDCNTIAETCTGTPFGALSYGDSKAQGPIFAKPYKGGSVITGSYQGTVNFGGGALTTAGVNDIFVASFDYNGLNLWSKSFGDAVAQNATSLAIDSIGSVLLTGDFAGKTDFGGGLLSSTGGSDVFVVKIDAAGTYVWSNRFGNASAQNGLAIAVDGSDNVFVTGSFAGMIDFGGGAMTSAGSTDVFLAKLGPDGSYSWSKKFGDASAQSGKNLAVDANGDVFLIGDFAGNIDLGGGSLGSAGSTDVYVAKLDGVAGTHIWSKRFGNASAQLGTGIAVDPSGDVVITGDVTGNADFGGGVLTSAGAADVFVAKLTSFAGAHYWSKLYGSGGAQNGRAVTFDPVGAIVLTGDFTGSIDFGGGALNSAGLADIYAAKLDANGAHVWSFRYGDSVAQNGQSVAADATGVLLAGSYAGTLAIGATTLTSAGLNDMFVARLHY